MSNTTVIYKGVEKVSPKKYQWSIVYLSKNTQDAHDVFDRLAMAMVIKGSANNYYRQMRNWKADVLSKEYEEYVQYILREKELYKSVYSRNRPEHITVLGMIKHLEKQCDDPEEMVFDRWINRFACVDWATQKEKSDMIYTSLGRYDYSEIIHQKMFGDAVIPVKNRRVPYGTQSRYERNQYAALDMLAEKLPSFKKNKKAKIKANKKTFRSNARKEIQQGLSDYNHYRLMSAKERFIEYYSGYEAAVQLRALMHDDVYATFYDYDDLEEVMSHLKQSENWVWHLEHVIPNHYLCPGEVCKKGYYYDIQDGCLVKVRLHNYNPMYREEEVIKDNADAGDWGRDYMYDWERSNIDYYERVYDWCD